MSCYVYNVIQIITQMMILIIKLSCILTIVTCISLFSEYFQLRVKIKCYYIEICYGVR